MTIEIDKLVNNLVGDPTEFERAYEKAMEKLLGGGYYLALLQPDGSPWPDRPFTIDNPEETNDETD